MNNDKQTEQVKCIVLEGYGGYDKIKVSINTNTVWVLKL